MLILSFLFVVSSFGSDGQNFHDANIPPEELLYTSENNYNVNNEFGKHRSNTKGTNLLSGTLSIYIKQTVCSYLCTSFARELPDQSPFPLQLREGS